MTTAVKKNKRAIKWVLPNVSPLIMLVNPMNLDLSYNQLVNETRTLGGFLEEFWGEQLTTLSGSGQSALFYNDGGLTNKDLVNTEGYVNFQRLVNIYRNNGKGYSDSRFGTGTNVTSTKIKSFGVVKMFYMNKSYEGYFDSFNTRRMADKPFNFEYDLSFRIRRAIGDLIVSDSGYKRERAN